MNKLSGFPYWEVQFTKEGLLFDKNEANQLVTEIPMENITDLFVMSHGWNNDMDEARELYANLVEKISKQQASFQLLGRRFAVIGVLWPSKKFAEQELIAGGAASLRGSKQHEELKRLLNQLDNLKEFFDEENADELLLKAKQAANKLKVNQTAQEDFVNTLNTLFATSINKERLQPQEEMVNSFGDANPKEILANLEDIEDSETNIFDQGFAARIVSTGGLQSGGESAGLGSSFDGIFTGACNLLNFVTYYQMKERAGKVGTNGLNPLLIDIKARFPLIRLHLIGHSFGARLVTAAVAAPDNDSTFQIDSLTLLQAAFSHYSFADKYDGQNNGLFRGVVLGKVKGPVLISHTQNDKAVGLAYAIASRIAKQVGATLGNRNDKYGGLGGNGAQMTPEAKNNDEILRETTAYNFKRGLVYNLNGDSCISGHSDICKDEVARAIFSAGMSTP